MTLNIVLLLLIGTATPVFGAESGKYVYIEDLIDTWTEAQTFCRNNYTDLASINNEYDRRLIQELTSNNGGILWFGLVKNTTSNIWMWSGGAEVKNFFWGPHQPNNRTDEDYGIFKKYNFHDVFHYAPYSVLCFKVHIVRERMTWEEALQYCRSNHSDLASVGSETEMMLIQRELYESGYDSSNVWIGLHFLVEDWVWIDGQPYEFDAWVQGKKLSCPAPNMSCSALELPSEFRQWGVHNCDERLPFLCY